jgi:biopolymer transport protein TolR
MSFGRLERSSAPPPMSDINMTPLIDVMLVLLVIFMVTAPLMASSLRLDLPATDGATPSEAPQALVVALDAEGRVFLAEERTDLVALGRQAERTARENPRTEVQLRALRPGGRSAGRAAAGRADPHRLRRPAQARGEIGMARRQRAPGYCAPHPAGGCA